jgi:subtilisin family serine protease
MGTGRPLKALIPLILLLGAAWISVAGAQSTRDSQAAALDKVEPLVMEELDTSGQTDFFIWMAEKADLSPAYQLETKEAKGRFVYEALKDTAERTQRELRRYLDSWAVDYRPFYIANKILVRDGTRVLLENVAMRSDVAHISANHEFQLEEPPVDPHLQGQILGVESNISFVNADDVWAIGITGQGIVLANNDSGFQWDHPALIDHYRGWNGASADHNYNWWDTTGTFTTAAQDDHGHGTHTTGILVGDDGDSNQIGMAPGAKTIHCKNVFSNGIGNDATFTECLEWDLAPWDLNGQNASPDLAPDAVNNSWGYQGGGVSIFQDEIAALHAAGILVEVSAGNGGFWCGSLYSPGDYPEVLTTGSVNHSVAYPGSVGWGSSRGPSVFDPAGYFPDIMAPGESVRSSLPGGGYGYKGGTSMAGPHATGLVGLVWSACPYLRGQVEETIQIIQETATPLSGYTFFNCGGDFVTGPNNEWGHGTIDAHAAVWACLESYEITLSAGWNLVSWPLAPVTENLTDTLATSCSACDQARSYDTWDDADPWKHWPGDLAEVDETMGLWLHATEATTLTITGWQPVSPTIELRAGWNLFGYPSQTARPVAEALASIDGCYTQVRSFDTSDAADPWRQYDVGVPAYANDLAMMEPGPGYWIYATSSCTLDIVP